MNRNIKLDYISTLEGFVLILTCDNAEILNVTCHSNESWIPDPADFIESCSLFTVITLATLSQGTVKNNQVVYLAGWMGVQLLLQVVNSNY